MPPISSPQQSSSATLSRSSPLASNSDCLISPFNHPHIAKDIYEDLLINNNGAGFAGPVEVAEGTTVQQQFEARMKSKPEDYLIRVNRQPVPPDQVLQEGDRVSFTPTKIEGA